MHIELAGRINAAIDERDLVDLVLTLRLRATRARREQLARLAVHIELAGRINAAIDERDFDIAFACHARAGSSWRGWRCTSSWRGASTPR